ncbi:hypothetical protein A6A27_32110 [Micromonospora sp. CB01531]|nr:hypothetical protein A6A27_32110 [Micromonospora sp. CB01531]
MFETYTWSAVFAVFGGDSFHSSRMRCSIGMARLWPHSRFASRMRSFRARGLHDFPFLAVRLSEPRILSLGIFASVGEG